MKRYIRVECVDETTNKSIGGYFCALMGSAMLRLGLPGDSSTDTIVEQLCSSDTKDAKTILLLLMMLGDIPKPDIYIQDKENHVCLYNDTEFSEAAESLMQLDDMVKKDKDNQLSIKCKDFYLEDNEILYEDRYQIVISKETYNKHFHENDYEELWLKLKEIKDFYGYYDLDDDFDDEDMEEC